MNQIEALSARTEMSPRVCNSGSSEADKQIRHLSHNCGVWLRIFSGFLVTKQCRRAAEQGWGLTQDQLLASSTAAPALRPTPSLSPCVPQDPGKWNQSLQMGVFWFFETILKQLLEDNWTKYYRNDFRPGEEHTEVLAQGALVWPGCRCWWSSAGSPQLKMDGLLCVFAHKQPYLSSFPKELIKGTSLFKEINCTTNLHKAPL